MPIPRKSGKQGMDAVLRRVGFLIAAIGNAAEFDGAVEFPRPCRLVARVAGRA